MSKNFFIQNKFEPLFSNSFFDIKSLIMAFRHEATTISLSNEKYIEPAHYHNYCEIYINISGNVRFMVEKSFYDISKGDIIITMPNEFHKCIFNQDCIHEHICIWIDTPNQNPLLNCFLKRNAGENNLISLPQDMKNDVLKMCLTLEQLQKDKINQIECLSILLKIIAVITNFVPTSEIKTTNIPETITKILAFMNKNFNKIQNISEVSDEFFISQSNLDRNFKQYLQMSPKQYLDTKKILYAKQMLEKGVSVNDACYMSGYNDCSHFIAVFKKFFNTTPNKIRKHI